MLEAYTYRQLYPKTTLSIKIDKRAHSLILQGIRQTKRATVLSGREPRPPVSGS